MKKDNSAKKSSLVISKTKSLAILFSILLIVGIFLLQSCFETTQASTENLVTPPPLPIPIVGLNVPNEALIGEDFTFEVTFKNTGAIGYGPFVDIVLPVYGIDRNTSSGPCDGIKFKQAVIKDVTNSPITAPIILKDYQQLATCNNTATTFNHQYSSNGVPQVTVPGGGQLITLELPFGSFTSNQPGIKIGVTVKLHNFADVGKPLPIYARGGFRFGSNALNDYNANTNPDLPILTDGGSPSNSSTWVAQKAVTPTVFKITKKYLGPEDEAVSGPNFTNYYPLRYEVSVDIADGQTVTQLGIQDCLEDNATFVGLVTSLTTAGYSPPTTTPCLKMSYGSKTGTTSAKDIVVTYELYLSKFRKGTNTPVFDPISCSNKTSTNKVVSKSKWNPLDPRDVLSGGIAVGGNTDYKITAKRLAIQKSVTVKKVSGNTLLDKLDTQGKPDLPIPGDYLEYKLRFQVSDYFTFGGLEIEDILSDGQELINSSPASPATFRVKDRFGETTGKVIVDVLDSTDEITCKNIKGGTKIKFLLSGSMINSSVGIARHSQGILTGGYAFTPTSNVPAEGEITFFVRIKDEFDFQGTGKEKFVDKEDFLKNCVTINGDILNDNGQVTQQAGNSCSDDSSTTTMIKPDILKKEIVARNNQTIQTTSPQNFAAGDSITFKITKKIPSGDWEKMKIQDWLPLPGLDISSLVTTTFPICPTNTFPTVNTICRTVNDNVSGLPAITINSTNPPDNSVIFDYGTQNNPANTEKVVEFMFTLKVTNKPYADGLLFTNEAKESEFNTFGGEFSQIAIAQFILTEPDVKLRKGVVSTSNPNSVYTPNVPSLFMPSDPNYKAPQVIPGNNACPTGGFPCPRRWNWNGTVTSGSSSLGNSSFLNNDLNNADANDRITFAIVLENKGSGLNGAWDVKINDTQDPVFIPSGISSNIQVNEGVTPFVNLNLMPNLLTTNITSLMSSGGKTLNRIPPTQPSLFPFNLTNGKNIAVITYETQLANQSTVRIGNCYENKATLLNYAATANGPNFVAAGFTPWGTTTSPIFSDTARVCINPTLEKSIVSTSEPTTTGTNVAIGETVRYKLALRIPEGTTATSNMVITDSLPLGMKLVPNSSKLAFVSTGGTGIVHSFGSSFNVIGSSLSVSPNQPLNSNITNNSNCGNTSNNTVVFNLGTMTNNDNDDDLEYAIIEFDAVVCNTMSNQNGTPLTNSSSVLVNGNTTNSNSVDVKVVEPQLKVEKTGPTSALNGSTISFTVKTTNIGTSDAFDVVISDNLPSGFTLASPPTIIGTTPTNCATPMLSGSTVTVQRIPPNCSVTVEFRLTLQGTCNTRLENTASAIYSSLPGANSDERDGTTVPLGLNDYKGTSPASVTTIECSGGGTGSLEVKKTFDHSPLSPPYNVPFNITVTCTPSGFTQTFTLITGNLSKTITNIPVGSVCTVTEVLPPPSGHPACSDPFWDKPKYLPPNNNNTAGVATITANPTAKVVINNWYKCSSGSSSLFSKDIDWRSWLTAFKPNDGY